MAGLFRRGKNGETLGTGQEAVPNSSEIAQAAASVIGKPAVAASTVPPKRGNPEDIKRYRDGVDWGVNGDGTWHISDFGGSS